MEAVVPPRPRGPYLRILLQYDDIDSALREGGRRRKARSPAADDDRS